MDDRQPAGFFERVAVFLIDLHVLSALFSGSFGAVTTAFTFVRLPAEVFFEPWWLTFEGALLIVALTGAYRWTRSPGMLVLDLDVIDTRSGERARLWQCAGRAIPRVALCVVGGFAAVALFIAGAGDGSGFVAMGWWLWGPWLALATWFAGYAPMRFTRHRQSLWDILTRTAVVRRPKGPAIQFAPGA